MLERKMEELYNISDCSPGTKVEILRWLRDNEMLNTQGKILVGEFNKTYVRWGSLK